MSSRRRRPKGREAVDIVENINLALRPSGPTAVGGSTVALECATQRHLLGHPAVGIRVRTSPTFGSEIKQSTTSKINYMGTTSYPADGIAVSIMFDRTVALARQDKGQADKATGGNARGIPPRGRTV
jgi:hypothetical protein